MIGELRVKKSLLCVAIKRIDAQRLCEMSHRLRRLAVMQHQPAARPVREGMLGVDRQRALWFRSRLRAPFQVFARPPHAGWRNRCDWDRSAIRPPPPPAPPANRASHPASLPKAQRNPDFFAPVRSPDGSISAQLISPAKLFLRRIRKHQLKDPLLPCRLLHLHVRHRVKCERILRPDSNRFAHFCMGGIDLLIVQKRKPQHRMRRATNSAAQRARPETAQSPGDNAAGETKPDPFRTTCPFHK